MLTQKVPEERSILLGNASVSYTTQELETILDILYNTFSYICALDASNQIVVSDAFDHTDYLRQLKQVEFTDCLETLVFNRAYSYTC